MVVQTRPQRNEGRYTRISVPPPDALKSILMNPSGPCPVFGVGRRHETWTQRPSAETKHVRFSLPEEPEEPEEPETGSDNTCQVCNKVFSNKFNMLRHIKIHSDERPFLCGFCDKGFRQKVHLTQHIASMHCKPTHASVYNYCCVFCTQGFMDRKVMRKHISGNHNDWI